MKTVLRHGTFPISDKGGLQFADHASMCFTATGRSALYHLARMLDCPHVLLPAFVPEGVLFPFVAGGKMIEFYRLTADLAPDWPSIQVYPKSLLVIIHYFGNVVDTTPAYPCNGAVLEDCAHAPLHRPASADFTLYSLNKFLPTPDGAVLLSRRMPISHWTERAKPLPTDAMVAYQNHLRANAEIARHSKDQGAREDMLRSAACYQRYYDIMGHDLTLYAPSPMARLALMADLEKINPKPWRAERVFNDKDATEVAMQFWIRGIHAADAREHWHVPSGHPHQDFVIIPSDTPDDLVADALGAARHT
jgi:hypothetical protein